MKNLLQLFWTVSENFELWFNRKFGWFLTNGNKYESHDR